MKKHSPEEVFAMTRALPEETKLRMLALMICYAYSEAHNELIDWTGAVPKSLKPEFYHRAGRRLEKGMTRLWDDAPREMSAMVHKHMSTDPMLIYVEKTIKEGDFWD